jgi:hypothetical protein
MPRAAPLIRSQMGGASVSLAGHPSPIGGRELQPIRPVRRAQRSTSGHAQIKPIRRRTSGGGKLACRRRQSCTMLVPTPSR